MVVRALFRILTKAFPRKVKHPIGISVDLTGRCNLRCRHCYFRHAGPRGDLDSERMLDRIRTLKKKFPSAIHAAWVGGEPLLRTDLLTECTKLFRMNMVVTNGTLPLPELPGTVFNVSVDGTRESHDAIRGAPIYDIVKMNADRGDIRVNINCVVNKENAHCVEPLVEEWSKTRIRGIAFSLYTPQYGVADPLYLDGNERDAVIERLLRMKKEYGDFILNSRLILRLMKSGVSGSVTLRCLSREALVSIDSSGGLKQPCVMGPMADCGRCGCIIPFAFEAVWRRGDFESLRAIRKIYS